MSIRTLTPLTGRPHKRRFAVYDLEWEPNHYRLGIVGLHDGKTYRYFTSIEDFLSFVLVKRWDQYLFFAHWGGIADTLFLFRHLYDIKVENRIVMNNSAAAIITVTKGKSRWTFVDSSFLFRVALAEILGWRGKKKGGEDELTWDVKYPKPGERWDSEEWRKLKVYNDLDCGELWASIDEFQGIANDLGARMGLTMSSTAMDLFRRKHLTAPISTPAAVNDFAFTGYYASRVEDYRRRLHAADYREVPVRNEDGSYSKRLTKNWGNRYDVNSSFVYAMTFALPGSPLREYEGSLDDISRLSREKVLYMAEVRVRVPDMYLPPLPCRMGSRLYFPTGEWTAVYTSVDIELALEMGCEILSVGKIIEFETRYDFKSYAEDVYGKRMKASKEKKDFLKSSLKLLGNGCYGKTTEGEKKQEFWMHPKITWCQNHFDEYGICKKHVLAPCDECSDSCRCTKQITPGLWSAEIHRELEHRHVQIGAFIVSYARRTLYRFQHAYQETLAYSDTDCGHIAEEADPKWIDEFNLGGFKAEGLCSHMIYLAPKVYGGLDQKGDPLLHAKGFRIGRKVYKRKQPGGCDKHPLAAGGLMQPAPDGRQNEECTCKVYGRESIDRFYTVVRGEAVYDKHMVRPREFLKTIGAKHPITGEPLISQLRDVVVGKDGKRLQLKLRPKRACACGRGKPHAAVHCLNDANLTRPWTYEELNQPWVASGDEPYEANADG